MHSLPLMYCIPCTVLRVQPVPSLATPSKLAGTFKRAVPIAANLPQITAASTSCFPGGCLSGRRPLPMPSAPVQRWASLAAGTDQPPAPPRCSRCWHSNTPGTVLTPTLLLRHHLGNTASLHPMACLACAPHLGHLYQYRALQVSWYKLYWSVDSNEPRRSPQDKSCAVPIPGLSSPEY